MRVFLLTILVFAACLLPLVGLSGFNTTPGLILETLVDKTTNLASTVAHGAVAIGWDVVDLVLGDDSADSGARSQQSQQSERDADVGRQSGPPSQAAMQRTASAPPAPASPRLPRTPANFARARSITFALHKSTRQTLYCGCDYNAAHEVDEVDAGHCGFFDITPSQRSRRVEVAHAVPVRWIGAPLACWARGGDALCAQNNPWYQRAVADLYNLFPVIGAVRQDRGDRAYRLIPSEVHPFGQCDFESVDAGVEPAPRARGTVARATLYMHETYGLPLREDYLTLMHRWNTAYPPNPIECRNNQLIARMQLIDNRFITRACAGIDILPSLK